MRRILGIPLSQYIWACMILALLLAARVKHGMDPQDAVTVGFGTWLIATAALVLGRWIRPVLPDWMRPVRPRAVTTSTFPWRMFMVGNTINLGGLLVFWASGITLVTFLIPVLALVGTNVIFFTEWQIARRHVSNSATSNQIQDTTNAARP